MRCLFKDVNERGDACNVFNWTCVLVCLVSFVNLSNFHDFCGQIIVMISMKVVMIV